MVSFYLLPRIQNSCQEVHLLPDKVEAILNTPGPTYMIELISGSFELLWETIDCAVFSL